HHERNLIFAGNTSEQLCLFIEPKSRLAYDGVIAPSALLQELGIAGIQDIEKHYLSGPWDLRYIFGHLAGVPGEVGRNQNFFKHFLSPLAYSLLRNCS